MRAIIGAVLPKGLGGRCEKAVHTPVSMRMDWNALELIVKKPEINPLFPHVSPKDTFSWAVINITARHSAW